MLDIQMMTASWTDPNQWLDENVRGRVEGIDKQTCAEWGGVWSEGTCYVRPLPIKTDHAEKTQVRSAEDGLAAFERYTDFYEYVLEEYEPNSDAAVLVPCGRTKPIGCSGVHQKKVNALKQADFIPRCDLHIVSEPCTIIPHGMRLSVPAVNYDFPPEFTEQATAPDVFDVFTDRLATWIDEMPYETLYPYLIARHQAKFDAALEKASSSPTVVEIPGASLNVEKRVANGETKYSGDQFKSLEDVTTKLEFVRGLKDLDDASRCSDQPAEVRQFYQNREEYQPV